MNDSSTQNDSDTSPDFCAGIDLALLEDGRPLEGRVGEDAVLLVRRGERVSAVGAHCPHKGAALADGLVVGETLRCPWHHAAFDLESGAASAPSLDPLPCWRTQVADGRVRVLGRHERADEGTLAPLLPGVDGTDADADTLPGAALDRPRRVVVVGAGAAGQACAEALRRFGFEGDVTLVDTAERPPIDRTGLSKAYLSGDVELDDLELRDADWYRTRAIERHAGIGVSSIDRDAKEVVLDDGGRIGWDALVIATGAVPNRLEVPGADRAHVHYLRSADDAERLRDAVSAGARRAVVIGASFIALEAAASLRAQDVEVTLVAPDEVPLAKVLGERIGRFVQGLHEAEGARFRLEQSVSAIDEDGVVLEGGERIDADLVVVGIGVAPATSLAEAAGLETGDGILVDLTLRTSDENVFAAGDVASWPVRGRADGAPSARVGKDGTDDAGDERVRIEHWVVAQRHGETIARNLVGERTPWASVPFFWSKHYGVNLRYAGHAEGWDDIEEDGDLEARDYAARYVKDGKTVAVATIGRDVEALRVSAEMEADLAASLQGESAAPA